MEQAEIQAIRQTMLRQESIFKEQVAELHRLYEKQRILLGKMKGFSQPALLGTRNFLSSSILDGSHRVKKRPRSFDLEKLPDEDDEEYEHHDNAAAAAADPPYAINYPGRTLDLQQHFEYSNCSKPRATVEMSLFPIPNRAPKEKSELPLLQRERPVGWNNSSNSTVGKLMHEPSFWGHQQQQQQLQVPQDPRWFLQSASQGAGFSLQPNSGISQWKNALLSENYAFAGGQQQGMAFGSRAGHLQNGRTFSNGFGLNYPLLNNVYDAVSKNNTQQHTIPTDLAWLQQQLPAAPSYIPQSGFGVPKVEDNRTYPEQQVPWYSGNTFQTGSNLMQSLSLHKSAAVPPHVPFPKAREPATSFQLQQHKVTNCYGELVDVKKPTEKTGSGTGFPMQAGDLPADVPRESEAPNASSQAERPLEMEAKPDPDRTKEENAGPSLVSGARVEPLVVDAIIEEQSVEVVAAASTSKPSGEASEDIDMTITDTATILLSLSPDPEQASCSKVAGAASKGQASLEAKLLSDLKLFKSVAIMLKKDLSGSKKRIPRPCRQQRGGGAESGKTGTSATAAASAAAPQSWLWGDVTRRKRMQRQRPQVHV